MQRYVVFTLHGERCYLCSTPLCLADAEIDHIVPERLAADPDELTLALRSLGLPQTFDLNSYGNWLPACRRCNGRKSGIVFRPSPIVQLHLQRAQDKAADAAKLEATVVTQRAVSGALNTFERAVIAGTLTDEDAAQLLWLLAAAEPFRHPLRAGARMQMTRERSVGHRLAHVLEDQRTGICIDPSGRTYMIDLTRAIPDLEDRGTQQGLLQLIGEALAVEATWDHFDGSDWLVLARGRSGVVELALHPERARAIIFAFFRLPGNLPNEFLTPRWSAQNSAAGGRVLELTLADQPDRPYCFLEAQAGDRLEYHPLGPCTLQEAVPASGSGPRPAAGADGADNG